MGLTSSRTIISIKEADAKLGQALRVKLEKVRRVVVAASPEKQSQHIIPVYFLRSRRASCQVPSGGTARCTATRTRHVVSCS